ncbi:MAG: sugar phosphate isomerase/epimerase [Clostridia bacterium]|nr:sugar phosphate isomerase/epimerase [Clostridia bacterium]
MSNKIGAMVGYDTDVDILEKFRKNQELGINSCQICIWNVDIFKSDEHAEKIKAAIAETGINVSSLWAGWTGPCEWNFTAGPDTIGLVPVAYRFTRLSELKSASDFAEKIGVKQVVTHVGFIPENPSATEFNGTVAALRNLCGYMKKKGQHFLFETGQETPITLLRTIEAIGTGNLGVNLDTANPILYGKANPVDALDVFGKYVMDTHIKDGFYPTNGMYLGHEARAGDGKANIPEVVRKLIVEYGYEGPFTIEREISGEQQTADIIHAKKLLEDAMANI